MRYNGINSILRACAEPGTAERTHKGVYVKVREPDATERLAVGRGAREGYYCHMNRNIPRPNKVDSKVATPCKMKDSFLRETPTRTKGATHASLRIIANKYAGNESLKAKN